MDRQHAASFVLLIAGVVLVFAGLISALDFSITGIVASTAAIAALLYAGGVWFGEAPRSDRSMVLFTRELSIAEGLSKGRPIADLFPEGMRGEIESRCRAALTGVASAFSCGSGTERLNFSVTPVRDSAAAVVYGLLLSGTLLEDSAPAAARLKTSTDPPRAGLSVS